MAVSRWERGVGGGGWRRGSWAGRQVFRDGAVGLTTKQQGVGVAFAAHSARLLVGLGGWLVVRERELDPWDRAY